MFQQVRVRGPVLFALVFAVTTFILSLLALLAGSRANFLLEAYIVQYDTSSLAATQAPNSTAGGVRDWYSFHYLAVCCGSWAADASSASSRAKTDVSCSRQPAGYELSISNFLPADVAGTPAAAALIDDDSYTIRARDPAAYFATWLAGAVLAGAVSVLLPMLLGGKVHMNGYLAFVLILAHLALLVTAVLTTLDAMELAETGAQCSRLFLALTWAAVGCAFAAFGGEFAEWNFQRFTPKGERIDARWRARGEPWIRHGWSGSSNGFKRWRVWA